MGKITIWLISQSVKGKQGSSVLKWSTRLQIAIDAALGSNYLIIMSFTCRFNYITFHVINNGHKSSNTNSIEF